MRKFKDLTDQRFGRLVCVALVGTDKGRRVWRWHCDCGTEFDQNANAIQQGDKRSCGCLLVEAQRSLPRRLKPEQHHGRARDLTGQQFGKLTAICTMTERGRKGSLRWYCICSCGGEKVVESTLLVHGNVTTCGQCKKSNWRRVELIGQVFGRLTVIAEMPERHSEGDVMWHCRCTCGGERVVRSKHLLHGKVTSCGCRLIECQRDNFTLVRALKSINARGPWACLFGKPYIRPRKGRIHRIKDDE